MSSTLEETQPEWELALAALTCLAALGSELPIGPLARAAMLVVAGLAFAYRPQILQSPLAWFVLAGSFAVTIASDLFGVGNHHFLGGYLSLGTGIVLLESSTQWREDWGRNGRWLLVGVMVFAVAQKLLSPEYLRGDFWGYFLSFGLAGKFVFATGLWDGPLEIFRQNREILATLGGAGLIDGAAATLKEPFPHFKTVVITLTWGTLVAEALVALGFLLSRRAIWAHLFLLGFVFLLLLIRPEVEFAALLLILGLMACGARHRFLRLSYGLGVGLALMLSLALQNVELGVGF